MRIALAPMKRRSQRECLTCPTRYKPKTKRSFWCSTECRVEWEGKKVAVAMEQPHGVSRRAFITAPEIAQELRISRAAAYRYAREMNPKSINRTLRIERSSFEQWLESKTIGRLPETTKKGVCRGCGNKSDPFRGDGLCSDSCREKARAKNPQRMAYLREYNRRRTGAGHEMAKRHGVPFEVMDGWKQVGCYYPGGNHEGPLGVDHDHGHCSGRYGCRVCSRGLLCAKHNRALGGIETDLEFTLWALQQPMLHKKIRREA